MPEDSPDQQASHWKQQYYEQLDLLDQKEKDWQSLESILKKTVLRLSITAEGQHATIDRYLHDIRTVVKKRVDVIRLENLLNKLSVLVLKLADKQVVVDKKVITMLIQLLEKIDFPDVVSKQKNKLIKKLSRSTDKDSDELADEVQRLLAAAINRIADSTHEQATPGFFKNLFKSRGDSVNKNNNTASSVTVDEINGTRDENQGGGISRDLIVDQYKQGEPSAQEVLVRLLEQLDVPSDRCEAVESIKLRIKTDEPATQKLAGRWALLLKDIAQIINTQQSGLEQEKQAFETFLQQITGRLKEMDSFLLQENASLNEAEQAGSTFDAVLSAQVQDIHHDMNTSCDLNELKNKVEKRLGAVSDHIKQYRTNEQTRYADAQKNVSHMQSRLQQLEQETDDLRELILVKDKQAMFDVLTKIPNRLSYEKKALEEIGRCKRFATPLSMAVWDIDLFKQVNDSYGHKIGDKVLHAVAQLLNERMRETDFIARYGGEEFVMFLPGADESEALALAEVLREKVSVRKFKYSGEMFNVTVSCGVTSYIEADSHESMFERADKALYAAKHSGRNKCLGASSL